MLSKNTPDTPDTPNTPNTKKNVQNKRIANVALQDYIDDLVAPTKAQKDVSRLLEQSERKSDSSQIQKLLDAVSNTEVESSFPANKEQLAPQTKSAKPLLADETPAPEANDIKNTPQEYKENTESADISTKKDSLQARLPATFQALLCDIAGMTIALPLTELGSIKRIDKLNQLGKRSEVFKGVLVAGEEKLTCIDLKPWLMPTQTSTSNEEYEFAVQVGKTEYALCCSNVSSTIEIEQNEVKWRVNPENRPWLVGIVKDKMCALVDSAKMVQDVLQCA